MPRELSDSENKMTEHSKPNGTHRKKGGKKDVT